jgi:short-subunit dehydrogenase
MNLRSLNEQVMVITGATSGIGLTTSRMAAANGARVFLIARNEQALRELADEINSSGGEAGYLATDVADENAIREAARKAVEQFGGIDTWVNNAGASVYGRLLDVSTDDMRRVFETNVWGVIYGSRVAADHLRENGGAIINVGSEVSDAPVPLQGIYSASKHAVKGFTDALRIELEADGLPISVTLIKPTAIHTPFTENAKNYLPYEPQLPAPVFAPDLVAEAILYCAENPTRDFFVGETAKLHSSMAMNVPRLYDMFNESTIDSMQNSGEPSVINRRDGLHQTNSRLRERGSEERWVMETSAYQKAKMHPLLTAGLLAGGSLAVAAWLNSRKTRSDGPIDGRTRQTTFGQSRPEGLRAVGVNRPSPAPATASIRTPATTVSDTAARGITPHMDVYGSDGQFVGRVDAIEGDQIKLTRKDSPDGAHHRIPLRNVDEVTSDRVTLSLSADKATETWGTA